MTMHLPWRPLSPAPGGPPISTSLTESESLVLAKLAAAKDVVEVGAAYGYSTVTLGLVARHVQSIDPHAALGSYMEWIDNVRRYRVERSVTANVASSRTVMPLLRPDYYGLVFIDGDHSEGAVESDIIDALRIVAPGGYIAVHDYDEVSCPAVRPVCDRLLPGGRLEDTLWIWQRPL